MSMKIVKITPEIWDEISLWYSDASLLPLFITEDTGFVVESGGLYVACAFLILTNSHFAIMEHLQVNEKVSKIKAGKAIIMLSGFLGQYAMKLGYKCIMGLVDDENTSIKKMHRKCFNSVEVGKSQKIILNIFGG